MLASDGIVRLPKETADKLYKTSEIYYEPDYYIYGVSMFHQLHCLDTIRRSFYRERYFPNATDGDYIVHRNHCLDYLRQAIMCNGDSSMTYWWNKNYTYVDEAGKEQFTDKYLSMAPVDRAYGTELLWDVNHQCRNFDKIQEWTMEHQLRNDAYWKEYPHFRKPNQVVDPQDGKDRPL